MTILKQEHPTFRREQELVYGTKLEMSVNEIDSLPETFRCSCKRFKYAIPRFLMLKMMWNQKEQGNSPDYNVFVQNIYTDKQHKGFTFSETKEGMWWYTFISDYRI